LSKQLLLFWLNCCDCLAKSQQFVVVVLNGLVVSIHWAKSIDILITESLVNP